MLEKLPEVVGRALGQNRAGLEKILINKLGSVQDLPRMEVVSPAFADQSLIPPPYTADGDGISPPLARSAPPADTNCIAVIVEDADSPTPNPLVHAIALLGVDACGLRAGDLRSSEHTGAAIVTGLNSYLQKSWLAPDPPPGHGPHRYVFQVFALASAADLSPAPGRGALERAVIEQSIAAGQLTGIYERPVRKADETLPAVAAAPLQTAETVA